MSQAMYRTSEYNGTGPENYEKYFVPTIGAPLAEDLVQAAALRRGERVLDVACGTGVVTRRAVELVGPDGTVAGLDVNPGMIAVARAATPDDAAIDWYETNIEATPLPDGSFDVVLCQMGLQFVSDKRKALEEIHRILGPGGRVVLNLPGPTPALFAEFGDALARHIGPECAGFVNLVFSLHDSDELRGLLSGTAFSDIDVEKSRRTLRLPPPQDFLWQYIHSTPLAAFVAKASEAQCEALLDEIRPRWQEFVIDGGMRLDVDMTTVHATRS